MQTSTSAFKIIFSSLLTVLLSLTSNLITAQNGAYPEGKKYSARTGATCKDKLNGGCMFYTYTVLEFKADSVDVYYYTNADCSVKEEEAGYDRSYRDQKKTYSWKANKDTITVNGYDAYGRLLYRDKHLLAFTAIMEMKFNEEIDHVLRMSEAVGISELQPYDNSVNISKVAADSTVKKCNEQTELILPELIERISNKGRTIAVDPGAKYRLRYKTEYHWSSLAGTLKQQSFCAEKLNALPVKGKALKRRYKESSVYHKESYIDEQVSINCHERMVIVTNSVHHIGNTTESGYTITYYYEKQ